MTLDHALRLIAMLVDTIAAQQAQIEALQAEAVRPVIEEADDGA